MLELGERLVVEVENVQVEPDVAAGAGVGDELGDALALGYAGYVLLGIREVVLGEGAFDVGDQRGAFAVEEHASSQQIARGAHLGRVDVGHREEATAQERCDLVGVDPVVLGLAAVDRLHVEGVAEDEGNPFARAEVGEPVPGEHALDGDDEVLAVRRDGLQEELRVSLDVLLEKGVSSLVENTEKHGAGMQINAAVELVMPRVELHSRPPLRWFRQWYRRGIIAPEALMSIKAL